MKLLCFFKKKSVSKKKIFLFTRQLSTLINAGLPLLESLNILQEQTADPLFKKTILQLIHSIQNGSTLSEALSNYPAIFDSFYTTMVKAGEAGGIVGILLQRLADFLEKSEKMKNKITSLLIYPTLILLTTCCIITFLLTVIVPKFEATFTEMLPGKSLPFLTECIIAISRGANGYLLPSLVALLLVSTALLFFLKTERGKIVSDTIKLRLPIFGTLIQKSSLALVTRTLGTLMENDVSILQALDITQEISGNKIMSRAIITIAHSLQEGDSIVMPMKNTRCFPPLVTSMIAVGEKTGQLTEMLQNVATIYEYEVDQQITRLLSLLEPLLILFLSILIGTIVIALFLPLITMMSEVGLENG